MDESEKLKKYIVKIVKSIAEELVHYKKNGNKCDPTTVYTLGSNQIIKIEDLLRIFEDDMVCLKDLLKYIVQDLGQIQKFHKELKQLSDINIYHRLLEYSLHSW